MQLIGQSSEDIANDPHPEITAIRDAIVVFLLVLIASLLAAGYPPKVEILYTSGLAAALEGITSYANAMRIKRKVSSET